MLWVTVHTIAALVLAAVVHAQSGLEKCASDTFQNLTLFGGKILNASATYLSNQTFGPEYFLVQLNYYPRNITSLNACEVNVTYTHPGQNDTITTYMWLPDSDKWNERFMGVGGGGWATGQTVITLPRPVADGYAAIITDGGHAMVAPESEPGAWALKSTGNVDWPLLQDFASIALDDMATLGKSIINAYYGRPQNYSYWNGCSTGGRQGHMMAQRYPKQYDGILASAPAINWDKFTLAEMWPQVVMNDFDEYPSQCELEGITQAVIEACDSVDGVKDGIISLPGLCHFDATTMVGSVYNCSTTGENVTISSAAAIIANATWTGPIDADGNSLWYGLNRDAPLNTLPNTTCTDGKCRGAPFDVPAGWIQNFLALDRDFDLTTINRTSFAVWLRKSVNIYESIMGTSHPGLTDFRDAGGKLLTWHGLADQIIFPNGTANYVQRVHEVDPHADNYYRFFEAPGIYHCGMGGPGWLPGNALQSLVDWVEKGVVPDTLEAKAVPELYGPATPPGGPTKLRTTHLCLWPKQMMYIGGDPNIASSFTCQ